MRILVVGRGAREHALLWRLARSPGTELFCAPGNAGTDLLAETVPLAEIDVGGLAVFARQNRIELVVVGPRLLQAHHIGRRLGQPRQQTEVL